MISIIILRYIDDKFYVISTNKNTIGDYNKIIENDPVLKYNYNKVKETKKSVEFEIEHDDYIIMYISDNIYTEIKTSCMKHTNNKFLTTISHKIREPLSEMIGYMTICEEGHLSKQQQKILMKLYDSSYKILLLANDIIDIANMSNDKFDLKKRKMNIKECLIDSIDVADKIKNGKDIVIKYNILPNVPTSIIADLNKLKQVLVNLLSNSIKNMSFGYIMISVDLYIKEKYNSPFEYKNISYPKQNILFKVTDTGYGVTDTENVNKILDIPNTTSNYSSINLSENNILDNCKDGFGLYISKVICNMMDGNIWYETKINGGSSFYFNIIV